MTTRATAMLLTLACGLLLAACGAGDRFRPIPGGTEGEDSGPTVTAVVPSHGSMLGGDTVQIRGTGFDAADLSTLSLGGVALEDVDVQGPTLIVAVTPAGAPGSAALLLEQGAWTVRVPGAFTYESPPPPPSVFVADGRGGVPGSLYWIDVETLASDVLGALPFALTGLAHGPDGGLWGVEATRRGALGDSRLVWIDPVPDPGTGELVTRVIGVLRDVDRDLVHQSISDITFVGTRLLGWTQDGDVPCEIDTATGAVTRLGAGLTTYGGGLAYDGADTVWLVPQGTDGALVAYDPADGSVFDGPLLSGASIEGSAIGAMTWIDGVLYALELSGQGIPAKTAALVGIDPASGLITKLLDLPSGAAAIARGDL